jgi:hypothetical protein
LRPDIFKRHGIPLELIFSQVGTLHVSVPWKSIGSKPVEVVIEDVFLVVSKS